jgi:hypothetical protein
MRKEWVLVMLTITFAALIKVVEWLHPDIYIIVPAIAAIVVLYLGFMVSSAILRERKLNRREAALQKLIKIKFEQFRKKHGTMFEHSHAYLEENDKKMVRRVLQQFIFIISPGSLFVFSLVLFLIWDDSLLSYIFLGFIISMGLITIVAYIRYTDILTGNEKLTIKGVITRKNKSIDGTLTEYDFTLSDQETVAVTKKHFHSYTLGDIVQIEILTRENNFNLKRTVRLIGRIKMN